MKMFRCKCGSDIITCEKVDDCVEICIWDRCPPKSLMEKLRLCWHVLTTGSLWTDQCLLTPEETKAFSQALMEAADVPVEIQ